MKVFIDFALIPSKIKCYSILQKRMSRMFDISNCDVIYYVILVICSHYVEKAISPLFAWPSSFTFICNCITLIKLLHTELMRFFFFWNAKKQFVMSCQSLNGGVRGNSVEMRQDEIGCYVHLKSSSHTCKK